MTSDEQRRQNEYVAYLRKEIHDLVKKEMKLLEHISFLKKEGYTYDQVNRKMIVCDSCGKKLTRGLGDEKRG